MDRKIKKLKILWIQMDIAEDKNSNRMLFNSGLPSKTADQKSYFYFPATRLFKNSRTNKLSLSFDKNANFRLKIRL